MIRFLCITCMVLVLYGCNQGTDSSTVSQVVSEENTTVPKTQILIPQTPPVLNPLSITIDENIAVGSKIGSVDINSSGDSPISEYFLSDENESFRVDTEGAIFTTQEIDYETKNFYHLFVVARNEAGESEAVDINISVNDLYEVQKRTVQTVVILMNWNDYTQNNPQEWYDKIFNPSTRSVNRWYQEVTNGEVEFIPIAETQGDHNDGIITVDMGKNHPGGFDDTAFRDVEIRNAVTSPAVVESFDFASLDSDGDGNLTAQEIQFIFIVAGGEESYGDNPSHSIWAHSWAFDSNNAPVIDGVSVMRYTGELNSSGTYARFGAMHDIDNGVNAHSATIGVMVHELGHSLLNLGDYYDNGGGSGLGAYDVMSGGAWMQSTFDIYAGQTPTQLSAFNKIDANLDINLTEVNTTMELVIKCDERELVKLPTSLANEYFLLECRDTAKRESDISFASVDSRFGEDTLFAMVYHVDENKTDNTEDGIQNAINHYKVRVVEKDISTLLTSTEALLADYDDVYSVGDVISNERFELYDTTPQTISVEVLSADHTNRTMRIKIIR